MEELGKALARIIGVSLIAGAVIVAVNPSYRETARSMMQGAVTNTPIWRSNVNYCPRIMPQEMQQQ